MSNQSEERRGAPRLQGHLMKTNDGWQLATASTILLP